MIISEVMRETGLTKKAIYYYEEVGLIKPKKEEVGNYRVYSAEDFKSLITIQALRKLDFSIKDIQEVLTTKKDFTRTIKKKVGFLSCEIERMNKSKEVLEDFIKQGKGSNIDDLSLLIQKLDEETKSIVGYMQNELDRILPGNLGKMFAIHYGQFLDESLDTPQKEQAWHDLIKVLDSQDEIQYPDNIKKMIDNMYGKYSDSALLELSEKTRIVTDKILERTSEVSELEKNEIKLKIEEYEKTQQYQDFLKFQKFTADNLAPFFKEIDIYMVILSKRFDKFHKILHKH